MAVAYVPVDDKEAKAQKIRIKRLATMLSTGLSNPASAIDALIAEMKVGEPRPSMWEGMHAIAAEGGQEAQLAKAYEQLTSSRQFATLEEAIRSQVLIHAAHFSLGIRGDAEAADRYFLRALAAVPDHLEVFSMLESKYTARDDKRPLLTLYGTVGRRPPKPPIELAARAANILIPWPATQPLDDAICVGLGSLVPASTPLLEALQNHCKKTGREALVISILERALESEHTDDKTGASLRGRLVALYPDNSAERALPHLRALLERDPRDKAARAVMRRLVLLPKVGNSLQVMLKQMRFQGHKV